MITTRIVGQELFLADTNTNNQYPLLVLQPGTTGDDLNWAEGLCHFIDRVLTARLMEDPEDDDPDLEPE